MLGRRVVVEAPSRLHFGMLSFGRSDVRQYGGIGAMIDAPELRLALEPAASLVVEGPRADEVRTYAQRVAQAWGLEPRCRLTLEHGPRPHVGLGTGTQTGMAVAAGLNAFFGRGDTDAASLARACGRGQRSSIGLYGFAHGGLLIEAGKMSADSISPLVARASLPDAWRFVLMIPRSGTGLAGEAERRAFSRLPPVPLSTTSVLCQIALLELFPAAIEGKFESFGFHLVRYNRLAGTCFASEQGGEYADGEVCAMIDLVRRLGVDSVAQTSWGPTVAALLANDAAAQRLATAIAASGSFDGEVIIATPNSGGARVTITEL